MKIQYIICVDDEPIILESLEMQLKRIISGNYIIEFCEDPHEALDLIDGLMEKGKDIKMVIADWLMPSMKGDEFLKIIHRQFPWVIKALLTGQADMDAKARVREISGIVIEKPWQTHDLINIFSAHGIAVNPYVTK